MHLPNHSDLRLPAASFALLTFVLASACGGSTEVATLTGPDGVRCQTSVAAQPTTINADGGNVAVTVTSARDCTWTATVDAPWMQLSATSGQGDGSLTLSVARNEQPSARTGALSINDQRVGISQEGRPCTFDLRGPSSRISSGGERVSIEVVTASDCTWTASTSASWISLASTPGRGSGTVQAEVSANPGPARSAEISIGNRQYTLQQNGAADDGNVPLPPDCSVTIGQQSVQLPRGGGSASVPLTIDNACDWSASSDSPWLTVAPASGRGNATIALSAPANTGSDRSATVTIAQQTVSVTQPGSCLATIDPASRSFAGSGGRGTVRVTTAGACEWNASGGAGWTRITTGSGTGNGEARYEVLPNATGATRQTTITIGGQPHAITQQPCTFSLSPTARTIPAAGGGGTVQVTTEADCPWSISGGANWVTVASGSRTGSAEFSYTVAPNTASTPRTATLTAGGRSHTITQEAAPAPVCSYAVQPSARSFPAAGGQGTLTVTTQAGCGWTLSGGDGWAVAATTSGTGQAEVSYTVQPNTATTQRTTTLVVNGQTHTVTQEAAAPPPTCTYAVRPESRSFPAAGGSSTFTVATDAGCQWTVSGGDGWVVPATASGTGQADVAYTVQANTTTTARTTTLVVNGQVHTVTQDGAAPPPPPSCTYTLEPAARSFPAAGGDGQFDVVTQTGCQWMTSDGAEWIAIGTSGGTGSGAVTYKVQANTTTTQRVASITVNGQSHVVTQEAAAATAEVGLNPGRN